MKKLYFLGLLTLLLTAMSCKTHHTVPADGITASVDSVPVESPDTLGMVVLETVPEIPEPTVILPFPDTIYPSAQALHYVIDVFEKEIPGTLNDLTDLYESVPGIFTFRGSPTRNPNFSGQWMYSG